MKKLALMIATTLAIATSAMTVESFSAQADTWHPGTPEMFHHGGQIWISEKFASKNAKYVHGKYESDVTKLNAHHGFDIYPVYFKANGQYVFTGADTSASAGVNPHYRYLGHGYYQITSGATGKNSLKYELNNKLWHMYGTTNLIKVINHNKIKMWTYDGKYAKNKLGRGVVMYRYSSLPNSIKISDFN